jgi:hypothetical protein
MAKHLPSAQARRGDDTLDSARGLRDQWKDVIANDDMTSIQNRILMRVDSPPWAAFDTHFLVLRTTDMRYGLDLKKGLPKMLHAWAYRRYAEETLRVVKVYTSPFQYPWEVAH